ncbi:MAG: hypothetical protein PF569_09260 [Candidatus Woesearchaeota archaeon]|jgi:hypothetical protein|nr:hypothetical protein [Candidatus Woesearchaeota archaeon]
MKYNIREDKGTKAIFDETGKQISDWWNFVWVYGLVKGESDFYLVRNDDAKEAIFHKSGIQISEWENYIEPIGLVDGTSNQYRVYPREGKSKTFTFDRTKFIIDQLKEKIL